MTPDVQRAWSELTLENARVHAAWWKVRDCRGDEHAVSEWREALKRQGDALARYLAQVSTRVRSLRRA